MARKKKVEEPVKRGRGRPKGSPNKPKDTSSVKVSKRGRGRPRKDNGSGFGVMLEGASAEHKKRTARLISGKKGPGRPKKVAEVAKRGRGRPANSLNKKTRDKNWDTFTSSQVTKKKRGRPAKVKTETVETVVKRGRGRPKKIREEVAPVVKRGRGRPRKERPVEVAAPKKRGRKPGSTAKVLRKKRVAPKLIKAARQFAKLNEKSAPSGERAVDFKTGEKLKRGRGRPKKLKMKKNAKAIFGAKLFAHEATMGPGRHSLSETKKSMLSGHKKRGRPKGKKDSHPRAKRGSKMMVGGTHNPMGLVKARLSHKSQSPMVTTMHNGFPSSMNVKLVAHRTPTVKIGKVTSRKGALKVSR